MKKISLLLTLSLAFLFSGAIAQTADEILDNYFETIGGRDKLGSLTGVKMTAKINQGGMEIPLEIYQMKDGRQITKINFQGKTIKQGVFDGTTLWNTNFQTMQAEKADAETTANQVLDANDFPESFFDYKKKGYKVELLGKETMDGTETFKIKLTKEPKTFDGTKVEDVAYYFFDTESYVPLAVEQQVTSGPQKGVMGQMKFSDYQEVDGLYFPFSLSQGVKDGASQLIIITAIELNPTIEDSEFDFPSGE